MFALFYNCIKHRLNIRRLRPLHGPPEAIAQTIGGHVRDVTTPMTRTCGSLLTRDCCAGARAASRNTPDTCR